MEYEGFHLGFETMLGSLSFFGLQALKMKLT